MESSISTGFSQLTVKVTSLQAQEVPLQKTAFPCAVPVTPLEDGLLLRLFAVASQSLAHLSLHCLSKIAAIWGDGCQFPSQSGDSEAAESDLLTPFPRPPEGLFS